jgi:cytochrome c553
MNESWPMMNTSMIAPHKASPAVSSADIQSLLRGRSFGHQQSNEVKPFEMNPAISDYNDADMQELQDYCSKRGILGVNFNGRDPKSILRMLKARMGDRTSINETKRGLLNG